MTALKYENLPTVLTTGPVFRGVTFDPAEAALMLEASKEYSKSRGKPQYAGGWQSDSADKQEKAGAAIKLWASVYLQPLQKELDVDAVTM